MDNTRQDLEEIYGNRRETINDLKKRNKKFAELTRVEFKRIILHIEGDLIGFEPEDLTDLTARFITQDRSLSFPAQSFELSGRHFHLWVNMMSANKEMPIETGNYILKIFKKYKCRRTYRISN